MDTQNGSEMTVLNLPATLDLAAAEKFLGSVRGAVASAPRLRMDASGVDALTLPCAQIIMSAVKGPVEVTIQRPSQAFLDAFADLALDVSPYCVVGDDIGAELAEPEMAAGSVDAPADQPDEPTEQPSMTKRILTIDDSKTIRDMLKLTLLDAGFEVDQAVDGVDGVSQLEKGTKYDVVITDINMPKMDGYGVIRHMRSVPELMNTPVLCLTTESEGSKRNIAREAGATGWMVKPFDPEQLIATIHKVAP